MTQSETIFRLQGNFSSDELAKHTKILLERKGIKSPDTSKMFSIKRGKSTYYYRTNEKYQKALQKFKEEDDTPVKIQVEEEDKELKHFTHIKASNPLFSCGNCTKMDKFKGHWPVCTNGHRKNKRVKVSLPACKFFEPVNYPFAKDKWASGFTDLCFSKEV